MIKGHLFILASLSMFIFSFEKRLTYLDKFCVIWCLHMSALSFVFTKDECTCNPNIRDTPMVVHSQPLLRPWAHKGTGRGEPHPVYWQKSREGRERGGGGLKLAIHFKWGEKTFYSNFSGK